MKKKVLKSLVKTLAKKLSKTEEDLKVLKHNDKLLEKDYHNILKENKWLKERNKCLETFKQKPTEIFNLYKEGFSVIYQYHYDEGGVEFYSVAQNIETEEGAKQIVEIFEKHNKDSHVHYVIGSPEIKS